MGQQHDNNKKVLQLQTEDRITQVSTQRSRGSARNEFLVFPCVALVGWYNLVYNSTTKYLEKANLFLQFALFLTNPTDSTLTFFFIPTRRCKKTHKKKTIRLFFWRRMGVTGSIWGFGLQRVRTFVSKYK
jgi:hypothetical protein